ncbi:hypothetical protein MYX84_16320 [Acidobacteria bacterium AH-259-O06]|nr:hypothetical protein [Acidobacteria bacterium AH-259-O06]
MKRNDLLTLVLMLAWPIAAWGQTVQYFPHLADGGGIVTIWYFTGLGAGPSEVTLELFQQDGNSLILQTDRGTDSTFSFSLEPAGQLSLRTLGVPIDPQVGWAKVTSSQAIGTTEVFQILGSSGQLISQAGVLPTSTTALATLLVTIDAKGRNTGVAVANTGFSTNPLTFTLFNQDGSVAATSTMTLAPQAQIARFISEIAGFEGIGAVEGSLGISGLSRFSVVTLLLEGLELSTLPVLPGRIEGLTSSTIVVVGVADITLAGMPTGFSFGNTSVPLNSPTESGLGLIPGRHIEISASGVVGSFDPGFTEESPEGNTGQNSSVRLSGFGFGSALPDNGISDLTGHWLGLIGVFLSQNQPDPPRPPALDFSGAAADIVRIAPLLKQTFYIGTGQTSQGEIKQFVIPDGATRLFLGILDPAGGTNDNTGSFTVNLSLSQ